MSTAQIRSLLEGYAIALLSVSLAFAATLLLQRFFPYPFLFLFFGAVMASGWFGGTGPGLVSVVLSTLLVDYFFVPPFHSFAVSASAVAYFVAFVACALIAGWVGASKRKNVAALKHGLDMLEVRVSERSAELMKTQAELAHLSQVLSMGELTASIAHEINQPLTAVVTHGHACVEWLSANPPNLEKTRQTIERIIQKVKADRVQLQQVVLNLMMNGMDAVAEMTGRPKELVLSAREQDAELLVRVEDSGIGLDAETSEKIFHPFFTTKPHGIGMGLSISRSIIEAHEGHLWAVPRPSGGAIFQFTLPIQPRESDA